MEVATCSVHGTWYLWDIKLRRAVRTGNIAGAASIVRFTPYIHTLSPPRPLLVTAHWSAQKREASVHLWDVFDPDYGRAAAAAGQAGAPPPAGVTGLWHSFVGVARGQVQDVAFTVDTSSAEEEKVLMAMAALDGSLVVLDLAAKGVLTHMTGGHMDHNSAPLPPLPPLPLHCVPRPALRCRRRMSIGTTTGSGAPLTRRAADEACAGADVVQPIHAVQYSRDGKLLMSCGADSSVKVWGTADMENVLTLLGHSSPIMKMVKIGPAELLATASESGELAFWDLRLAHDLALLSASHYSTS